MLCGARSYSVIAEWGRNYGTHIARALGFRYTPPCAATLHLVFRRLDCARFEAQLGAWVESVVASLSPGTGGLPVSEPAVALDGKTLRGSRKQGAPGVHRLSALAHQVGVTLAQQAVADKTNESTAAETVLSQLVLTGRVVTMDALLTQTAVAQTIVDTGGDYVMVVKANQPQLRADMALIFAEPPVGDAQKTAGTIDIGHGRIEQRR
jgi:DDE family transposase